MTMLSLASLSVTLLHLSLALAVTAHALLNKRHVLAGINRLAHAVTGRALLAGNAVAPLAQGDGAFPARCSHVGSPTGRTQT